MTLTRLRRFPALLLLSLAACGGDGEAAKTDSDWPSFEASPASTKAANPSPLPRACSLLDAAQASATLQTEAGLMSDDAEACLWSGSEGVGNLSLLSVIVVDSDDLAMAETVYNGVVGQQGNLAGLINGQVGERTAKSGQELDDLGDEAWLSSASVGESFGAHGVTARQLVVRKGTRMLTLNVTGTRKSAGLGVRMEQLARAMVGKL